MGAQWSGFELWVKLGTNKERVVVPYSKMKEQILNCLLKHNYLTEVIKKSQEGFPVLEIKLKYDENKEPKVHDVKRISKPSRRMYFGQKDIKPVKQGTGLLVLSTPKGILVGSEARREHVGGEVLFQIW